MEGEAGVLKSVIPSKQTRVTDEHFAWTFEITPRVEKASMKCKGSREGYCLNTNTLFISSENTQPTYKLIKRVLSESFPMNTNMTGFRWFSKYFAFLCFGQK